MDTSTAIVPSAKATNQVLGSLTALFLSYEEKLNGISKISEFMQGKDGLLEYFTSGTGMSLVAGRLFTFENAKACLDAEYWSKAIEMTDVLECMSAAKRNEWHKNIHEKKTPSFDREIVLETIRNLLLSRGTFIAEKVDGIFRKLSGDHVTNSPMGFRNRMIISYVLDSFGYINHDRAEYLHDLRSVIAKIQGRDEPKTSNTQADLRRIASTGQYGEWHDFDGGAFKVRLYKVGTAHMEVHPEIALKLNSILSSLYPMAIAGGAKKLSKKEKSIPLRNDVLPYEVTKHLSEVADSISRGRSAFISKRELDKKTYAEIERVLTFLGGSETNGLWSFAYDAVDVLVKVIRTGCLPEKVSHQFYPTQKDLAQRLVALIDPHEGDKILEPSAGHGAIVELLPKEGTTCVEINEINAEILKAKGYDVVTTDFLKWDPEPGQCFNKIVMNPPFAKGAAERHVKKASALLAPNGILAAILPASLRDKTIVPGMNHEWSETISGAFEGTGAHVVILTLTH